MANYTYNGTITNTYSYYGYPQAENHFVIDTEYFTCKITRFGIQGLECPNITPKSKNGYNGYFWSMHLFNKLLWNGAFDIVMRELHENESKKFVLNSDPQTVEFR